MRMSLAVGVALIAASPLAAEQSWELRGDFVAMKPGKSEVVVLRLADGRTIEVPVESLSPAGQASARQLAAVGVPAGTEDGEGAATVVAVRGPFGRMVRVSVPESIKDVEADAIHCRSAAEALEVYQLFLAGDRPTPAQRTAAEARLKEWVAMAEKGLVRLGDRWVLQAEKQAASDEAAKIVAHALELMQLGNADLAEEELQKAGRVNPESGRAAFVMGLAYSLVAKNSGKAFEHFADVVRRSPDDPAALSNLAVLEVYARRHATVVDHFRDAIAAANDPLPVAENIAWAIKLASDAKGNPALAKTRMPDKTVGELNALYKTVTQDLKLKLPTTITAPHMLGPNGIPFVAANLADVAKHMEAAEASLVSVRHALGFAVGPEHVVCPRSIVVAYDGKFAEVFLELPSDRSRRMATTVVAAPPNMGVALLKCDSLRLSPLPLARQMPSSAKITAVDRDKDSWLGARLIHAEGKVLSPTPISGKPGVVPHTAIVPRGLGGGPIMDAAGHVIGVLAPTPRTESSGNTGGLGLPIELIWPMINDYLPDIDAAEVAAPADPAVNGNRGFESTVIVTGVFGTIGTTP